MATLDDDTIAAIATPPGRGGVGILRVSGAHAFQIAEKIIRASENSKKIMPRTVVYSAFYGEDLNVIDQGIVLYFSAPHSFTGEDVIEFQCHGSPVVLDRLLTEILLAGARIARAGEFSERAFLNNKLDLVQSEAVADLINASTEAAARSAMRSLDGVFSNKVNFLIDELVSLRAYIEAAIDFPEEEVDFLTNGAVCGRLDKLLNALDDVVSAAQQGALLAEGCVVVIAGKPNAGKSSLLNALAEHDAAIVSPSAGTTRDILREHIQINGMPIRLIDTAGLWESNDLVEREGIRRAQIEIANADLVLLVVDGNDVDKKTPVGLARDFWPEGCKPPPEGAPIMLILNKCDLSGMAAGMQSTTTAVISIKTGEGLIALRNQIASSLGFRGDGSGLFSARRRHLDAMECARSHIEKGRQELLAQRTGELLAENLRLAQQSLEIITGRFAPDDLLDKIFRDFCIGK